MKRIKQINESKERISKAFIELIREYKFEDINITDITLTAQVTRMTFYMGGVDLVTMKWIKNGMKESSEEITERIVSLL